MPRFLHRLSASFGSSSSTSPPPPPPPPTRTKKVQGQEDAGEKILDLEKRHSHSHSHSAIDHRHQVTSSSSSSTPPRFDMNGHRRSGSSRNNTNPPTETQNGGRSEGGSSGTYAYESASAATSARKRLSSGQMLSRFFASEKPSSSSSSSFSFSRSSSSNNLMTEGKKEEDRSTARAKGRSAPARGKKNDDDDDGAAKARPPKLELELDFTPPPPGSTGNANSARNARYQDEDESTYRPAAAAAAAAANRSSALSLDPAIQLDVDVDMHMHMHMDDGGQQAQGTVKRAGKDRPLLPNGNGNGNVDSKVDNSSAETSDKSHDDLLPDELTLLDSQTFSWNQLDIGFRIVARQLRAVGLDKPTLFQSVALPPSSTRSLPHTVSSSSPATVATLNPVTSRLAAVFSVAVQPALLPSFPSLSSFFPPPAFTPDNHDFWEDFNTQASWVAAPGDQDVLTEFLRWTLRRISDGDNNNNSNSNMHPHPSLPPWYTSFKEQESNASYPVDSYTRFLIPNLSNDHSQALGTLIDLISSIAAHGHTNNLSIRRLSHHFGWWIMDQAMPSAAADNGTTLNQIVKQWESAANAFEHVVLAAVREKVETLSGQPLAFSELCKGYPAVLNQNIRPVLIPSLVLKLDRTIYSSDDLQITSPTMLLEAMLRILQTNKSKPAAASAASGSREQPPRKSLASSIPTQLSGAIETILSTRLGKKSSPHPDPTTDIRSESPYPTSPISAQFTGTSTQLPPSTSVRSLASMITDAGDDDSDIPSWDSFTKEGFGQSTLGDAFNDLKLARKKTTPSTPRSKRPAKHIPKPDLSAFELQEIIVENLLPQFIAFLQESLSESRYVKEWPYTLCILRLNENLPEPYSSSNSIVIYYVAHQRAVDTSTPSPTPIKAPVTPSQQLPKPNQSTLLDGEKPRSPGGGSSPKLPSWARRASQQISKQRSFLRNLSGPPTPNDQLVEIGQPQLVASTRVVQSPVSVPAVVHAETKKVNDTQAIPSSPAALLEASESTPTSMTDTTTSMTECPQTPSSTTTLQSAAACSSPGRDRRSGAPSPATIPENNDKDLPDVSVMEQTNPDEESRVDVAVMEEPADRRRVMPGSFDAADDLSLTTETSDETLGESQRNISPLEPTQRNGNERMGGTGDDDNESDPPRETPPPVPMKIGPYIVNPAPVFMVDSNAATPAIKVDVGRIDEMPMGSKVRIYGKCMKYIPAHSLLLLSEDEPNSHESRYATIAINVSILLSQDQKIPLSFESGETLCVVGYVEKMDQTFEEILRKIELGTAYEVGPQLVISAIFVNNPDRREADLPLAHVMLGPVVRGMEIRRD